MTEKIYVTQEFFEKQQQKIKTIQSRLEDVRMDKAGAFQGDTNTWHDNFGYESATRTEKMTEDELFKLLSEVNNYIIAQPPTSSEPKIVEIWSWVKVLETNIKTQKSLKKTIGIVPVGAEDHKKLIYHYRAPVIAPLLKAKVGDVKTITIPMGIFEMKVLEITRMTTR